MNRKVEIPNAILLEQVSGLLNEGHSVVLKGKGNSMIPFIQDGVDSILLSKVENDDLRIGDIALARLSDGNYVIHRIIEFSGERVTLMGDGNLVGTEMCNRSDILAYATKIIKPSGERVCRSRAEMLRWKMWYFLRPFRQPLLSLYLRVKFK